jgi:hypothetical protein
MTRHARPRALTRALSMFACAVATAATMTVATADAASAATCRTRGHAYMTQPGRVHFSGFEGDQSLGIPRVLVVRGDLVRFGGNGIRPGTNITFGTSIQFTPNGQEFQTRKAGSNCVVNESAAAPITAPPGT